MPRKKSDKANIEKVEKESVKKISEEAIKDKTKNKKSLKPTEKSAEKQTKQVAKELAEKAKKLGEKIEVESLKEKLEQKKKIKETSLVPLDDYVKSGIYIGTKVITPNMRRYIYRRRADGISIINTNYIDEKLKEAISFLSNYKPEEIIVVCKRESGWKAVNLFSELTGIRVFTKKYPAGILTNLALPDFFEPKLVFICDPWLDKNAMNDAKIVKKKIMSLCDTNNYTKDIDVLIPCNNKSSKSLGLIFFVIAREYLRSKGIKKEIPPLDNFIDKA